MLRLAKRTIKRVGVELFRRYVRGLPSPPFDRARVRKILLPAYAGIGNIVLYTPALRALRRHFPDAEIVLAVGNNRSNDEVLGRELVDRVVEIPLHASLARRVRDVLDLRRERFDLCINAFFCYWPYQVAFSAFARIPWRCGHVSSPGWKGIFDELYNIPATMERDQYESDRYLELAYALGVERGATDSEPSLSVAVEARGRARTLLDELGVEVGTPYVVVHAGTSAVLSWKQWGVDRFESVVLSLAERRPHSFVLVGAPDERQSQASLVERLAESLGARFVDLVGATDIPTLVAVIEGADLLVGNDSGPMQIAVALRVPVVVPWGPSDHPRNAPRGALHTILFKSLPCAPCYHMPGDSQVHLCTIDRKCLRDIGVDEVVDAADEKLVATSTSTRGEGLRPR
jgi:ADP-heptose:LPS heptosyltransferase